MVGLRLIVNKMLMIVSSGLSAYMYMYVDKMLGVCMNNLWNRFKLNFRLISLCDSAY